MNSSLSYVVRGDVVGHIGKLQRKLFASLKDKFGFFIANLFESFLNCPEGYCDDFSCETRSCEANHKLLRMGNCDCCGTCIQLRKEGSPCQKHVVLDLIEAPKGVKFMNSDCEPGFVCKKNKCTSS
ncbi:hypothetical protein TNIN_436291 [Trichonephila inaurata madagascariensis]|uniref:Uncharacterized protein n=1 Tax=Trichonephila inaurata madagascariensis TaxID=2747483 RepID=A0A8X6XUH7_9ARAC|nr:hypothetical protein TNIN_436291 [Trichonephila inaurata madagascariensis]